MIEYDPGFWGLRFVLQLQGSVFPKALAWALPNAACGVVLNEFFDDSQINLEGVDIIWAGYTFVLGFLMVFRNNQAYTRFWEGGTLINQMRGEWLNATSSLMAFCTDGSERQEEVEHFQQLLVRLMSMLHCSALQQVADLEDDTLEIICTKGMDDESLAYLEHVPDRCEILIQWIQRHVVVANSNGLIMVAPPILSRAFNEIGRGIVNLSNAKKIRDIPFPFPYAQMITCMLVVHWLVTPLLASYFIVRNHWVAITCFCVTASMWSLIYIAQEIDQPFGNDANDLPVGQMQIDFNEGLQALLDPLAQVPPAFDMSRLSRDERTRLSTGQSNHVFRGVAQRLKESREARRETSKESSRISIRGSSKDAVRVSSKDAVRDCSKDALYIGSNDGIINRISRLRRSMSSVSGGRESPPLSNKSGDTTDDPSAASQFEIQIGSSSSSKEVADKHQHDVDGLLPETGIGSSVLEFTGSHDYIVHGTLQQSVAIDIDDVGKCEGMRSSPSNTRASIRTPRPCSTPPERPRPHNPMHTPRSPQNESPRNQASMHLDGFEVGYRSCTAA